MIDAAQIRAARGLLDWTRDRLAAACGVSVPALGKIEAGKSTPHTETIGKVQAALEQAGIVFGDGSGVKRRNEMLAVYEGVEGFRQFSDDRYFMALHDKREFLMCGGFQEDFIRATGDEYYKFHADRMTQLDNFRMRALIKMSNNPETASPKYIAARFLPSAYHFDVPFYVYGSKLAIITVEDRIRIIVIHDEGTAASFRRQFDLLWKVSTNNNPDRVAHA